MGAIQRNQRAKARRALREILQSTMRVTLCFRPGVGFVSVSVANPNASDSETIYNEGERLSFSYRRKLWWVLTKLLFSRKGYA